MTQTLVTRRIVAAVALLLLVAGCARAQTRPGGIVVGSSQVGWATKAVVTKRAPETLLAGDGTICRVSPDRFRGTAVGDRVDCNWQ